MSEELMYAKAYKENGQNKTETLEEHTRDLLENLDILKKIYSKEINNLEYESIWKLLKLASIYHDLGKVSDQFQKKIRVAAKKTSIKIAPDLQKEIPHNFLSPAFFSFIEDIDDDELRFLFYAVAYHHNRKIEFDDDYLKKIIKTDLVYKIKNLEWLKEFNLTPVADLWDGYFKLFAEDKFKAVKHDKNFILLKGLLHRLDHSASAHLNVEEERVKDTKKLLIEHIKIKTDGKYNQLRDFQNNAENYRDKSVMLIASTGMGKTEFAINWIGQDKAFYTLPLRVSVNSMYDRFCEIFTNEKVGLLHGDSLLYGLSELKSSVEDGFAEDQLSIEEHIHRTNITRQFSMPLTITTADQIFTSVFKWKGYEKIYATLMYSKVVLDEPQSYSPDILAMIIRCLQEISKLGGRFCFMSATIHPFIREKLEKCCTVLEPVYNTEKKHKLKIENNKLDFCMDEIVEKYNEGKKVLVICNTVKKSQEIFESLSGIDNVKLLHSGFIQRDRREKEREIKSDYNKNEPVVWVTTQLVEASLDIDYDILFTEIATIDALIQRMGRIYRRIGRVIENDDKPNIIIAIDTPSDKYYIYDENIVEFTRQQLIMYDGEVVTEIIKQEMMNVVFDYKGKEHIEFFKKFYLSYKLLESGFEADNKTQAQQLFRNITNATVIPEGVYNDEEESILECVNSIKDKNQIKIKRLNAIKTLNDFTISIPYFKLKNSKHEELPINQKHLKNQIFVLVAKYDKDIGIIFEKNIKDFIEFL